MTTMRKTLAAASGSRPITRNGLDGADFCAGQGARRVAMPSIATDERRRHAPKAARRGAVAFRSPLDCVAGLRVAMATRLRCAPSQRAPERDPGHCQGQGQALWAWL